MAILMPTDIGKSEALLDKLRDDPRVSNADLDVNFYDAEAL